MKKYSEIRFILVILILIIIFSTSIFGDVIENQDEKPKNKEKFEQLNSGNNNIFFSIEYGFPFFKNAGDLNKYMYRSIDLILKGGMRFLSFGFHCQLEYNSWEDIYDEVNIIQNAFNFGLGGEFIYFKQRARTSLSLGAAVKLNDNALQESRNVGIFFDFRPVGILFHVSDFINIVFDPLTLNIEAPVLKGVPLIVIEFRTILGVEFKI